MNLYTKYRSKQFSKVIGQQHVVKVLTNAILHDRVAHAYLFSGPRGTGKTTLARLLAKSLNCENRKANEFESCDKCNSCKEIVSGSSMDIIEIDAASNRGIDEIRQLREKVKFAPSGKKYKIFIIDEVHMLTREAFNALLKTLEEPPKHAIFILATTELHKVPDTIISRTQQFDFKLHAFADIAAQLTNIAKSEKIKIDKESIELISQSAQGGLRDAISLLDQVSNMGGVIDEKVTREILGLTTHESLIQFIDKFFQKDLKSTLDIINSINEKGADFCQFIYEVLEILRKLLLFKSGYEKILNNFTEIDKKKIVSIAHNVDKRTLVLIIEKLLKAYTDTKYASITQLPLEIVVFEYIDVVDSTIDSNELIKPIKKEKIILEKNDKKDEIQEIKKEIKMQNKPSKPVRKNKINFKFEEFSDKWPDILKSFKGSGLLNSLLKEVKPMKVEQDILFIAVPFNFHKDKLEDKKVFAEVNELFDNYLAQSMSIKFVVDETLVKEMPKHDANNFSSNDALSMDASEIFG